MEPSRSSRLLAVLSALTFVGAAHATPPEPIIGRADLHAHLLMGAALGPFYLGEPGRGPIATSPSQGLVNPFDVEGLERAGIRLVVVALWIPPELKPDHSALDEALRQVRLLERFAAREPAFVVVKSAAQARAVMASRRIALLPAIEGGDAIRSVRDVDRLHAAGVRVVGLVQFADNRLAEARDEQLGLASGLFNTSPGGLSALGADVVRRMTALGMIVDVSHASERTMHDVLDLAERHGTVVIASHEGSAHKSGRSLSDEPARRIAAQGGLVGVGIYNNPIADPVPAAERWPGYVEGTCDDVVAHWLHYRRVAGDGAVVLGSDLGSTTSRPLPGPGCPTGIRNIGDVSDLFGALTARGVPREFLDDSGARVLRLLARAEAQARGM